MIQTRVQQLNLATIGKHMLENLNDGMSELDSKGKMKKEYVDGDKSVILRFRKQGSKIQIVKDISLCGSYVNTSTFELTLH